MVLCICVTKNTKPQSGHSNHTCERERERVAASVHIQETDLIMVHGSQVYWIRQKVSD
jgi:hypothetical protein